MADALSAISLLLAAFAVLFGLWYPIATEALAIVPKKQRLSRNGQIAQVRAAFCRMLAMLAVSALLSLIFAKRAICIVIDAVSKGGSYDDLRTALVAAEATLAALALFIGYTVLRLWKFWSKLDADQEI